jgi:hypothetical protein
MSARSAARRRWGVAKALAVRRLIAILLGFAGAVSTGIAGAEAVEVSFLAVGDTGAPASDDRRYATQLAVGAAMTASDRDRPVNGVVFLGDNFYPDGLQRSELVPRIRANLVKPYCRFLMLTGPRAAEVSDACADPQGDRHPAGLLAILGNHDHASPGSAELQREGPAEFIGNWRMPRGAATLYELGAGLSLVAFDSTPVFEGAEAAALGEAIRLAPGPWRILLAHHPLADRDRGDDAERHARYRRVVLAAIAAAGTPVQLVLSAHEHNLQLLGMDPPAPALHVIAGGGSGARSIHGSDPNRLEAFEEPGFARIDLVGAGESARLVVSLYGLPRFPRSLVSDAPRLLARRSVDLVGRVSEE